MFILQDKVHDFSRLNNKDLLDSTIDAVGDIGLKVLFYLINYILIISTLILLVAMLLYNSKCPSVRLRQKGGNVISSAPIKDRELKFSEINYVNSL